MHVWYVIKRKGLHHAIQWNSHYGSIDNMPAYGPFWSHHDAMIYLSKWLGTV